MQESEICFMTAMELAARIRAGDLFASEVMEAHLGRIERTNPLVNAIVTLLPEKALEEARAGPFMQNYEFLVMPVSQIRLFDINRRYVTQINGEPMETYIDWMQSCYYVTVTGLPAASVPCGFTPESLPVDIQIVGRPGDGFGVLQLAHAFEEATEFWRRRPPMVRDA